MEIYPVSKLRPGDRLARAIYGAVGQLLLAAGTTLTPNEIARLTELGIPAVYLDRGESGTVFVDDVVRAETRAEATRALSQTFQEIAKGTVTQVNDARVACESILDEILRERQPVVQMVDVRTLGDYTLGHSVSVCILSLILGRRLGLGYGELKDLGLGALFHDVGRVAVTPEIWFKTDPLTKSEWEEVYAHPTRGFEVLRGISQLRVLSAHVAYQHHERLDGSGYPRAISGEAIHLYARIAAVADVYDALIHDRPYRPGIPPHHALGYLKARTPKEFDTSVVRAFLQTVAPYPIGTRILLRSGMTGVVERVDPKEPDKPVIRLEGGRSVDLAKTRDAVHRVISGWGTGSD